MVARQDSTLAGLRQAGRRTDATGQMAKHMPGAAMMIAHVVVHGSVVLVTAVVSLMPRHFVVRHAGRVDVRLRSRHRLQPNFGESTVSSMTITRKRSATRIGRIFNETNAANYTISHRSRKQLLHKRHIKPCILN